MRSDAITSALLAAACLALSTAAVERARADEEEAHGRGEGTQVVQLSAEQRQALAVASEEAGPARMAVRLRLTGQVSMNLDRMAHVTPRVSGVVRQVQASFGDRVEAGQVLAVLESRPLAEARAAFLTTRSRLRLAETTFARAESLWQAQIWAERQYLDARQALEESRIASRAAEQQLHAVGVGHDELRRLSDDPDDIGRYLLVAPIPGTVVDRHATVGEVLSETDPAFLVADLRTVWVELSVPVDDLRLVRAGQAARVVAGDGGPEARGAVEYLAPVVDVETRTARARVAVDNGDGSWRPGTPVHAFVTVHTRQVPVAVPRAAVYDLQGRTVVFVDGQDGIRPRAVEVGGADEESAEVTAGLEAGERVIARGGVHVKSAFLASEIGDHDD